jgi:hypothetical protein
MDARYRREPHEVIHREYERPFHKAVHDQTVSIRIDRRHASVMTLEV